MINDLRYIERNGVRVLQALRATVFDTLHWCEIITNTTSLESKALEFKEGKFYKNRLGEKLIFLQNRTSCFDNCSYIFYNYDTGSTDYFTKNGCYYNDEETSDGDIVGELEDKNE